MTHNIIMLRLDSYAYLSIKCAVHYDLLEETQARRRVDFIKEYLYVLIKSLEVLNKVYTHTVTEGRRRVAPLSSPCL